MRLEHWGYDKVLPGQDNPTTKEAVLNGYVAVAK
jgi:hypothetical protein